LGAILDIPVIHLDAIFWLPNWVKTPRDEWRRIQEELIKPESWIIDGHYESILDNPAETRQFLANMKA
jgi:adenylate kinase family enzyme